MGKLANKPDQSEAAKTGPLAERSPHSHLTAAHTSKLRTTSLDSARKRNPIDTPKEFKVDGLVLGKEANVTTKQTLIDHWHNEAKLQLTKELGRQPSARETYVRLDKIGNEAGIDFSKELAGKHRGEKLDAEGRAKLLEKVKSPEARKILEGYLSEKGSLDTYAAGVLDKKTNLQAVSSAEKLKTGILAGTIKNDGGLIKFLVDETKQLNPDLAKSAAAGEKQAVTQLYREADQLGTKIVDRKFGQIDKLDNNRSNTKTVEGIKAKLKPLNTEEIKNPSPEPAPAKTPPEPKVKMSDPVPVPNPVPQPAKPPPPTNVEPVPAIPAVPKPAPIAPPKPNNTAPISPPATPLEPKVTTPPSVPVRPPTTPSTPPTPTNVEPVPAIPAVPKPAPITPPKAIDTPPAGPPVTPLQPKTDNAPSVPVPAPRTPPTPTNVEPVTVNPPVPNPVPNIPLPPNTATQPSQSVDPGSVAHNINLEKLYKSAPAWKDWAESKQHYERQNNLRKGGTDLFQRTFPGRLDDHINLLADLGLKDKSNVYFIDIGPGLGDYQGPGKEIRPDYPAITSLEVAKAFSKMNVLALDLPEYGVNPLIEARNKHPKLGIGNQLLNQPNLQVIGGDGLKSLKEQMPNARDPFSQKPITPIADDQIVILRACNSIDIYCDWEKETQPALAKMAADYKEQTALLLFNNKILVKPAHMSEWLPVGVVSERGFNHNEQTTHHVKNNAPHYSLKYVSMEDLRGIINSDVQTVAKR